LEIKINKMRWTSKSCKDGAVWLQPRAGLVRGKANCHKLHKREAFDRKLEKASLQVERAENLSK
jgi:hypothetical protein